MPVEKEQLQKTARHASHRAFAWYAAASIAADAGLWLIAPALALLALGFQLFLVAVLFLYLTDQFQKASRGEQVGPIVTRTIARSEKRESS